MFSDLQADIVADLSRRGLTVHTFNQRSVAEILEMIRMLGAMVDASERAQQLVGALEARLPVPSQARGFLSSVPHNGQLVSHAAMCLDAVARPD
jgi:iron complex transport system substrate-binding protein